MILVNRIASLIFLAALGVTFAAPPVTRAYAAEPPIPTACEVLMRADLRMALGEEVTANAISAHGISGCEIALPARRGGPARTVSLTILRNPRGFTTKISLFVPDSIPEWKGRVMASVTPGMRSADIAGVGDAAIWTFTTTNGLAVGQLHVLKVNTVYFFITMRGIPDEEGLATARRLGVMVAANIDR